MASCGRGWYAALKVTGVFRCVKIFDHGGILLRAGIEGSEYTSCEDGGTLHQAEKGTGGPRAHPEVVWSIKWGFPDVKRNHCP
jgi:hypothetical protein